MNKATQINNVLSPPPDLILSEQTIRDKIVSTSYTLQPSGKTMVCEVILQNGFSVIGTNSAVHAHSFDTELGKKFSFGNAMEKIWELEGYLFQDKLYQASLDDSVSIETKAKEAVGLVSLILGKQ